MKFTIILKHCNRICPTCCWCQTRSSFLLFVPLMATHSSTLAWRIPWTEEPGRLQSMRSLSRTRLSDFTFTFHFHTLEKEMATQQCSCLENPGDGAAWWTAVYGVAQSWTRLKRLSSSSSIHAFFSGESSLPK